MMFATRWRQWLCFAVLVVVSPRNCRSVSDKVLKCKAETVASRTCLIADKSLVFAVRGSTLKLKCSYTGQNRTSLSWYSPQGLRLPVDNVTMTTAQLIIRNTLQDESGIYVCTATRGPGNKSLLETKPVLEVHVKVIIGDIPDPPLKIRWQSVNFNIAVVWTSSGYTDTRVNTTYSVTAQPFCAIKQSAVAIVCSGVVHEPNQTHSCPVANQNDQFACTYQVFVIVTNVFGSSNTSLAFMPLLRTTPLPPKNLTVSTSGVGQVTAQWELIENDAMAGFTPTYRIVYKQLGAQTQKTVLNCGQTLRCVITGLQPYTWYQFFVQVMLDPISSPSWSGLAGPVAIQTSEEQPVSCPTVTSWSTHCPDSQQPADVVLEWKLPDNRTWNGAIKRILITHYEQNSQTKLVTIVNNTSQHVATLTRMHTSSYAVLIQMCNSAGCCESNNITWISSHSCLRHRIAGRPNVLLITTISIMALILFLAILLVTRRIVKKLKCCVQSQLSMELEVNDDEQILVESQNPLNMPTTSR